MKSKRNSPAHLIRKALCGALCAALCIIPSACSRGETNPAASQTDSGGITLRFGGNESAFPASGIVQQLAADYEKETGVHISFDIIPDAQWRDLIQSQLAGGTAPDIFVVDTNPISLNEMVNMQVNCIDLSNEEFIARLDASVIPSISYQDKIYGITFSGEKIWIYTYNKALFDSLGIKAPTTYAQLKEISQTILDAGVTPMWEATNNSWHQALPLFESGPNYQLTDPDIYDKLNANTADIQNIPGLKTILSQLKEYYDLGYMGSTVFGNNLNDDIDAIAAGKVAMTLELLGFPLKVTDKYPEMTGKLGIFVMPWNDNQTLGINPASNAYFGNIHSDYPEEIKAFFRFLARHENLEKRFAGDPSEVSLCWKEVENRLPEEYQTYLSSLDRGTVMQAGVKYIDPQWMEVGSDIEELYAGHLTVDDVLENLSRRRGEYAVISDDSAWN
ncbi:MAG: ABC transporter substrate-binding protein [Oscillospiraceae bacterium]